MADEMPTLADLRRKPARRAARGAARPGAAAMGSLFAALPEPVVEEVARPTEPTIPKAMPKSATAERVFSVAELVAMLRGLVEQSYARITVEGEISNWRPSASGHCYFTLKDGAAQLSVVMFRSKAQLLRFRPKDGDAVRVRGQLSVYDARGQLQLIAESMQQTGLGAMLAAVQELKARLKREGLFENQRPLPAFPRCIGVVTSTQGAALRDIVKVCRRRHAAVRLLVYPAAVQGPNCAVEIARGVEYFSRHPELADVVLVARGGGSWEDLHGFDDERVVRAIAACSVPVITGIGHATDTVLADAAADVVAPTPSAAAELVTAAQFGLSDRLSRLQLRMVRATEYQLLRSAQRLDRLSAESVLGRTSDLLERRAQHVDVLMERASTLMQRRLRATERRLLQLESSLRRRDPAFRLSQDAHRLAALRARLVAAHVPSLLPMQQRLARATAQLQALSPLRVLERGYALVYVEDVGSAKLLHDAATVREGAAISAQLARGRVRARVTQTQPAVKSAGNPS